MAKLLLILILFTATGSANESVRVPNGKQIMPDGKCDSEEWKDAIEKTAGDKYKLLFKKSDDYVFICVKRKLEIILKENAHIFESNFPLIRFWQPPQFSVVERLSTIKIPTLIIIGNKDYPAILEIADKLETNIGGARKVVIANAGHMVNMDQPSEFNRVVIDFLKEK